MVTAALVLALIGAVADPVGVVQVVRGDVRAAPGGPRIAPAQVVRSGDRLSCRAGGWAEISLVGGARVRMSAGTELVVRAEDGLRLDLIQGRVWVQRTGRRGPDMKVHLRDVVVRLDPMTSAIVEHTRSAGMLLAVRSGALRVEGGGAEVMVRPGRVLARAPGRIELPAPRTGGRALAELVAAEARSERLEEGVVRAFLQRRAQGLAERRPTAPTMQDVFRGGAEVRGSVDGAAGALVEDALRPPPFFEEEVPTKGPNVDVEVRFP